MNLSMKENKVSKKKIFSLIVSALGIIAIIFAYFNKANITLFSSPITKRKPIGSIIHYKFTKCMDK